ncbi:hypothetical protein L3X38_002561 [Prunus dulcis]|uniref:DUF4283 domain-containing protein n=1 Tax=Prunus dulcis TaxID=3755 RepID=A0AAD4ZK35_PRUDU|nr:hypothetical protein L3X38_002561 [Prunus dulcis]
MNPQLVANSSHTRSRSSSPRAPPNPTRNSLLAPSIIQRGRFTFTMENNKTRVSTIALASSVQGHFESFCLVGKVFGIPVPRRAIRNRLKSDWKNLHNEVSVDHIDRDWYKIEFCCEEDVEHVMKNRPWFVQGQIFALQRWRPDFSPFHATSPLFVGQEFPFYHYTIRTLKFLVIWSPFLRPQLVSTKLL